MAKKKARDLSLDNALMASLPEDEYVKNPLSFAQIRGDFSLSQTNLMIGMVSQMQDKIERALGMKGGQLLLFDTSEMTNGMLQVEIPLNQLGIIPQRYGDLEAAVDGLMAMKMTYKSVDEKGVEYDTQRNIFYEVSVPTETRTADGQSVHFKNGARRKGVVKVKIYEECVKDIFNMKKGYIEHLRGIARLCRCSRTPRLYIYLSAWRKRGHFTANFNDLKEFLGVLAYNKERTRVIKNQYEKFSVFLRDVLNPVREEMKRLAEQNLVEFYFEYEPVYKGLKRRGTPDSIAFTLIATQKGIAFDANKRVERLHATLITTFKLQPEEWARFAFALNDQTVPTVTREVFKIVEAIEKKHVVNQHAYATTYIMNLLGIAPAQEVAAGEAKGAAPQVSDADQQLWARFAEAVGETVGEDFAEVFVTPCRLYEATGERIVVMAPTQFVKEKWLERAEGVRAAVGATFGGRTVEIVIDPEYR